MHYLQSVTVKYTVKIKLILKYSRFFVTFAGASLPVERVTDGIDTSIEYAPWVVSLQYLDYHFCTGTLVTRRHVLTTANCVYSMIPEQIFVQVGSASRTNGGHGLLKAITNIMVHPNASVPLPNDNDIAVLTLKYPALLSTHVRPIAVAHPENNLTANQTVLLSGWQVAEPNEDENATKTDTDEVTEILQTAVLSVVDQSECATAHGNVDEGESQGQARVNGNMLCAVNVATRGNSACTVR